MLKFNKKQNRTKWNVGNTLVEQRTRDKKHGRQRWTGGLELITKGGTRLQWLFAFSNYALFPPHPSQIPGSNPQSQSIQVWLDSGLKCSLSLYCPLHLSGAVKPRVWYGSKVEAAHLVSPFLTFTLNRKMQPNSLVYGTFVPIPRPSHSPINQLPSILCSQLGVGKGCFFKRETKVQLQGDGWMSY